MTTLQIRREIDSFRVFSGIPDLRGEQLYLFLLALIISLDYRVGSNITGAVSVSVAESTIVGLFCLWQLSSRSALVKSAWALSVVLTPVLYYMAWVFLAAIVSLDKVTLQIVRDILVSAMFGVMVVCWCRGERGLSVALSGFTAGVLVNCLLGVSQVMFGGPRPISLDVHGSDLKESHDGLDVAANVATGMFSHPNPYAIFLGAAFVVMLGWIIFSRNRTPFGIVRAILALFLIAFNLYFTFGKGALLWCVLGALFMCLPRGLPKRWYLRIAMGSIVGVVVLIVFYILPMMSEAGGGGTIEARVLLWGLTLDLIFEGWTNFLFGGIQERIQFMSAVFSNFEYGNAHNFYLNQAVYFGVPGLVLCLMFFVRSFSAVSLEVARKGTQSGYWISRSIFSALIVILGDIFFEPMHAGTASLCLIMLFCALARVVGMAGRPQ